MKSRSNILPLCIGWAVNDPNAAARHVTKQCPIALFLGLLAGMLIIFIQTYLDVLMHACLSSPASYAPLLEGWL